MPSAPAAGYVKRTNANPSVESVGTIANADLPTTALSGVLKYTAGVPTAIGASSTNCVHEDGSSGSCGGGGGVPYTGATGDVDLGVHKITAAAFEGTAGTVTQIGPLVEATIAGTGAGTLSGLTPTSGLEVPVSDGLTASDCTTGGGSNHHWCVGNGTTWAIASATDSTKVPTSTTVNGHALSSNVTVTAADASAQPIGTVAALSTTCAGTVNWAVGSVAAATITTTGTCNLTVSGMAAGGYYTVLVTQGSGGSHALTLGTGGTGGCASWKVGGGGSGAVTPSTVAGKVDVLAIFYDGSACWANFRTDFN
jgi:hypothetical protein